MLLPKAKSTIEAICEAAGKSTGGSLSPPPGQLSQLGGKERCCKPIPRGNQSPAVMLPPLPCWIGGEPSKGFTFGLALYPPHRSRMSNPEKPIRFTGHLKALDRMELCFLSGATPILTPRNFTFSFGGGILHIKDAFKGIFRRVGRQSLGWPFDR